jgi:hypothetical protein
VLDADGERLLLGSMIVHRVQQRLEVAGAVLGVFSGVELLLAPSSSR